jgi:hypothetical protein
MMDTLSARQQRLLALSLLWFAIMALWFGVLYPIVETVRASGDERQAILRAVSRDRALVSQAPAIQSALTSLEQSPRWARFYASQKADQATLQLETDLRTLLTMPNALTSMTAEPATVQGPLTRIAVKVTLSMPIDQLAQTFAMLQSYVRLLHVDSLTVQAPDNQASDSNPRLTIQAEIVGFMLTPKTTQS